MAERPLILFDALLVRPQPTGVARSILELTRALAAVDRGFDFAVLAAWPAMFADLGDAPGWKIRPCTWARRGTVVKAAYTQLVLPHIAKSLGAALLHSTQFVRPLRLPCASVVTVHDLAYLRYGATIQRVRQGYYRLCVPPSLRRADAIVTNSEATAREVVAAFPEVAARVTVTPFGTPEWALRRFAERPPTRRSADAPFLFVGTLEPRKNLERLLAAYERLLAVPSRPPHEEVPPLEIIGARGWNDRTIQRRLRRLIAGGKVRTLDYLEADQLAERLAGARALLYPSLHEGFGFPILEAMAAGTPVLTSARGAMAEVAGDAALLVDPMSEEAIVAGLERLIREPDLAAELVARGRHRVQRWRWRDTAEATVAVYRRLLAPG